MTDPRPRPQYGEYATPEEQAKAMGITAPAQAPADPAATTSTAATSSAATSTAATTTGPHAPGAAAATPISTDSTSSVGTSDAAPVAVAPDVPRARPAYGEHAPAGSAPFVPPVAPGTDVAPTAASPVSSTAVDASTASTPATPPRRLWDVVLTAVLLGMGVVSVVSSIPQYANFGATLQTVVTQMGYGEFTAVDLANSVGIAINVSQIVLLFVTLFISIRVVQRGRLGFYIPLIGGAVSGLVLVVLFFVAILGDPTFLAQLNPGL